MNHQASLINLLIINHNEQERLDYVRYLTQNQDQNQFKIIESDSAENGLALCYTQNIDCLIIDHALLDPKGLNFVEKFYKDRQLDHKIIPIILMTNPEQDPNLTLTMLEYGVQDILFKTTSFKESLLHAVHRAIQTSQEQRAFLTQNTDIKSNLFDHLMTQIKDALFIFELKSGHFVEANSGAIKSFQIDPAQNLSSHNLYNLPALEPGLSDWENNILLAKQKPNQSILFQTQYQTASHKILPLQVDLRFVPSDSPDNGYLIAMAYDIEIKTVLDQKFQSFSFFNTKLEVYSFQYFNLTLEQEFRRAMRMNCPLSLILLQPRFSDSKTELTETQYQSLANTLSKQVKRAGDLLSQYQNTGFCFLFPNTNAHQAYALSQLLLKTLHQKDFLSTLSTDHPLHFAIGIGCQTPTIHHDIKTFWKMANTALEQALKKDTDYIEIVST